MMLSHLLSPLAWMDSLSLGLVYGTAGSLLFRSLYQFIVIYNALLIVRILLSWFPQLNWSNPILSVLSQLTDPYLNLFRGIIPPLAAWTFPPGWPSFCSVLPCRW